MPRTETRGGRHLTNRRPEGSASVQDYLAAIYVIGRSGRPVIGARLATQVGVSPPAASEAIQRLARAGYVRVSRGKRLRLTATGQAIAAALVRRRRLLERWLTDALGLDVVEAREEAHRLEHAVSPHVERRLAEILGMPDTTDGGAILVILERGERHEP